MSRLTPVGQGTYEPPGERTPPRFRRALTEGVGVEELVKLLNAVSVLLNSLAWFIHCYGFLSRRVLKVRLGACSSLTSVYRPKHPPGIPWDGWEVPAPSETWDKMSTLVNFRLLTWRRYTSILTNPSHEGSLGWDHPTDSLSRSKCAVVRTTASKLCQTRSCRIINGSNSKWIEIVVPLHTILGLRHRKSSRQYAYWAQALIVRKLGSVYTKPLWRACTMLSTYLKFSAGLGKYY